MGEARAVPDRSPVPDFLTIEEAARVCRIGRTAAYKLARQWRETGGKVGLPNVALGSTYRVPTAALEAMLGRTITYIPPPPRRAKASNPRAVPAARPGVAAGAEVRPLRPPQPLVEDDRGQRALPL